MSEEERSESAFFPAGCCLLVNSPMLMLIRTNPYCAHALNDNAYRVLECLGQGASFEQLKFRLQLRSKEDADALLTFLKSGVEAGILTRDSRQAGVFRVKQTSLQPPLERVFLEVTAACNLHCAHCYVSAGVASSQGRTLADHEVLHLIHRADELGVYRFDFTGGEIFTRPGAHRFLRAAREAFMIVNIFTNGTLLTEERCAFLADLRNIRTVFVSLDDVRETAHDAFRGVEGAFRRTVEGIRRLRAHGIRVVVNITIWKENASRASSIINYCQNVLGVECRVAPMVYVGRGKCFEGDDVHSQSVIASMSRIIGDRRELRALLGSQTAARQRNLPGCGVGHRMLHVRSDGEICLCPTLSSRENAEFRLGMIGTDDIGTVWESSEALRSFRTTQCRHQECVHFPECRGGCRSRAFLQSGSLYAEDPLMCEYFRVRGGEESC